ncbi:MAG: TolC family protein [Ignavibacteriaceae bacterium]|nr:TolC family protein [Ignavibacteriaceae bacterium]
MKRILIALVLITSVVTAQNSNDTLYLDLGKAVEIALKNNNDLKIARYNKDIADEKVDEAWGGAVYPEIKGTVNYRRALKKGVFTIEAPGFSGTFPIGTDNTLTSSLSIYQNIFSAAVFIGVSAAETFAQMSEKELEASRDAVKYNVKNAYNLVMLAQEVVEVNKVTLANSEENLKNAEVLYKQGLVSEYDLVRARVQVQNAIPELEQAENAYKTAMSTLKYVLGFEDGEKIAVTGRLVYEEAEFTDLDSYFEHVMNNNPMLLQSMLNIKLRDQAASAYFADHFPTINAFGSWNVEAQENDSRSFPSWRYVNSINVGLELKIPIFNGWRTTSKINQAQLEYKIAQETLLKTKKGLRNKLEETLLKINNQKDKIKAYRSGLEQAELAYNISKKRFSEGLATQLEIVDALLGVSRAKFNYLNGIYEYKSAIAALEQLLSKELKNN